MAFRTSVRAAALATLVCVFAAPASADHEGVLCDYLPQHGIGSHATHWPLPYRWLNWTYWDSDHDYIGLRRDGHGNITFRQWFPGGPPSARTTTYHGYDEFRTSGIQRAGYSFATYSIRQWSHDGCDEQ